MIGLADSMVLGLIQGLTEFLPVSSSAHLVIFQAWFGLKEQQVFFDVMLHLGTLGAVFLMYRYDLRDIFLTLWKSAREQWEGTGGFSSWTQKAGSRLALWIVVSSIPTAIIGFSLKNTFESLFASVLAAATALLLNGAILWTTVLVRDSRKGILDMSWLLALAIGFAQGVAITPGISRSGITICAGLLLGLKRDFAVKYSFLMSIPAILGAAVLELGSFPDSLHPVDWAIIGAGVAVSFLFGYLAIHILTRMVIQGNLRLFSVYCWVFGTAMILTQIL